MIPFRDKYNLSDKEALDIAKNNISVYEMAMLLKNSLSNKQPKYTIKLKASVGDTLYGYTTYWGIIPFVVDSVCVSHLGNVYTLLAHSQGELLEELEIKEEDIGKEVFFTYEEAEKYYKQEENYEVK